MNPELPLPKVSSAKNGGSAVNVAASAGGSTIIAANASRVAAIVKNNDTGTKMHITLGTTPTVAAGYPLEPGESLVIPYNYTGAVNGISASGTIEARVIEI